MKHNTDRPFIIFIGFLLLLFVAGIITEAKRVIKREEIATAAARRSQKLAIEYMFKLEKLKMKLFWEQYADENGVVTITNAPADLKGD